MWSHGVLISNQRTSIHQHALLQVALYHSGRSRTKMPHSSHSIRLFLHFAKTVHRVGSLKDCSIKANGSSTTGVDSEPTMKEPCVRNDRVTHDNISCASHKGSACFVRTKHMEILAWACARLHPAANLSVLKPSVLSIPQIKVHRRNVHSANDSTITRSPPL
ncbi:hypothetical protein PISMIDRAFT_335596 [Pisolithus microcarpus 441]|uniref:Uncharacterized protein n=1 Tax=Pisolithus microcarpus 441 TaxID=765257 RepID=A0A0C9YEX0_9AGAM|nr:hypothetical protein PISMIDRAFT_335596 [Pisolithus microcarpus 441]